MQPLSLYTEDSERGARLNYLLCDVATRMCHNVFHQTLGYPQNPTDLLNHFASPNIYCILKNLKKGRVITLKQWDLLFPAIPMLPDSKQFDITLWSILLRSICGLASPANGWDSEPNANENTLSANLVRLRLCRNRLRGHIASTLLTEDEFNTYWQEVEDILTALGCPKADIDRWKTESLDSKLVARHNDLLNDLQKLEDLLDKEIAVIKGDHVRFKAKQKDMEDELKQLQDNEGIFS